MTIQHVQKTEQTAKNLQSITEHVPIKPYYEDAHTIIYHADNREND